MTLLSHLSVVVVVWVCVLRGSLFSALIVNLAGTANIKCAKKLGDEEQFDRFFGEVFRHHSGQDAPSNGEGWLFTRSKPFLRDYCSRCAALFSFDTTATAATRVLCRRAYQA